MIKTIPQLIAHQAKVHRDGIAFREVNRAVTYQKIYEETLSIATVLSSYQKENNPIVIFLDKGIACLSSMFAIMTSGNFYTVLDVSMPADRILSICKTLEPFAVITDKKTFAKAKSIGFPQDILLYEDMVMQDPDREVLARIEDTMIDTDPAYALFTSGSTGVPKGTVVSHRSVLSYATWVCETFAINEHTVFGNQTPFYFSMSVLDIYATLYSGATLCIVPKMYFSFPAKLMQYLNEVKVNTIYWVPSALCIVADLKVLDVLLPKYLEKILFAGEVMPMKQLNIWRSHLPHALYANLYGPTEVTDICTYYIVNREFRDDEHLPIGRPCNNCDVFLLKDDGTRATLHEEGEICVRGSFLASGYYNEPEKSAEVFVQNPLQPHYHELIYRTGDIGRYNEYGELLYVSRRDHQIKHMGYRIELGEVEHAFQIMDGMGNVACIYDDRKQEIVCFYQSERYDVEELRMQAEKKLPRYMRPNAIRKVAKIPHNANGKIDRVQLKKQYEEEKEK